METASWCVLGHFLVQEAEGSLANRENSSGRHCRDGVAQGSDRGNQGTNVQKEGRRRVDLLFCWGGTGKAAIVSRPIRDLGLGRVTS